MFAWIKTNNFIYALLSLPCAIMSFASYQTFVFIYITLCIFGFILLCDDRQKRSSLKVIIKLIFMFVLSFVLYEFIIRNLMLYSGHNDVINWHTMSKKQIVTIILDNIKNVLIGSGVHYNLGYSFGLALCVAIIIYKLIKDKDSNYNKLLYVLSFFAFFMTPFYLCVVQGGVPLYRSQLVLPFTEAFLIMFATYYGFKNRFIKFAPLLLIFLVFCSQMSITQRFYYTENYKTEYEISLSNQIIKDLQTRGINENSKVVLIGRKEVPFNSTCLIGEMVGASSYSYNCATYPYYLHSTDNILGVWRCLGYDYTSCRPDEINEVRELLLKEKMPNWPEEGSIRKYNDYYIIKLSEDDLPW